MLPRSAGRQQLGAVRLVQHARVQVQCNGLSAGMYNSQQHKTGLRQKGRLLAPAMGWGDLMPACWWGWGSCWYCCGLLGCLCLAAGVSGGLRVRE